MKDWLDVKCNDCVCKDCELEGTDECIEWSGFCVHCNGEWGKDRCNKQK